MGFGPSMRDYRPAGRTSFAGRYEKQLPPETTVVVATDIIEPRSTPGEVRKQVDWFAKDEIHGSS